MAVEYAVDDSFVQLDTLLIRNPDLSNAAFRTYALLLSYKWQDDTCFPGQDRMEQESGMSARTIRRAMQELQEKGLVACRQRGQRRTNEYSFPDRTKLPIKHESDGTKLPINLSDRTKWPIPRPDKITPEIYTEEKDSVITSPTVSRTILETVCSKLGIKKDMDAEELVERSMAMLPDSDHVKRALLCKGYYDDWARKSDMKRAGHFETFCKNEKNPQPGYTVKSASSNGGSSPTEYVRFNTPILTTVPQARAMFQAIKETGTCPMKTWNQLESLTIRVRRDGTLMILANDEQTKQEVELLHRHRIDMACRESHLQFEIGVGA